MPEPTFSAIIIKGNELYTRDNVASDQFYDMLQRHVESLGLKVAFFEGDLGAVPPFADLWIGHSSGAENLKFAGLATKTINIGNFDGIYHPQDNVHNDDPPNQFHFELTDEMKRSISQSVEKIKKLSEFQEKIIKLAERMCE